MPKLSKEERAELEARLAEDDADDDDDEVEVGFADGSYVRGRYRRVSEAAAARGFKLRPDPPADDDGKTGKTGKASGGEVRRFSGRRIS